MGRAARRRGARGRTAAWALLGGVAVSGVWAALAAVRPGSTFHFAPALVVWAVAWLAWPVVRSPWQAGLSAAAGGVLAVAAAGSLAWRGLMAGPWLFGGSALGEAVIVTAVAVLVAAVAGAVALRRTGRGANRRA